MRINFLRATASGARLAAYGLICLAASLSFVRASSDEAAVWSALRSGGHVALLRHALAPGNGDPARFRVGDCSTQRNLDEEGRAQARRIGARLKANGIVRARVFSSQWCRCLDTAELLGLGPVAELPPLNSFFGRPERKELQMKALRAWLSKQDLGNRDEGPTVLVTHQVVITALTGIFPASGELVVIRVEENGRATTVGSIETD